MADVTWSESARLPGDARSVGEARRFVRDALARRGEEQFTDDALLCVSEVVTNALLHAGGDLEVSVELRPGCLRIGVRDTSAVPAFGPRGLAAAGDDDLPLESDATTGRGLLIVMAVASGVGETLDEHGKTVWFELSQSADEQAASSARYVVQEGLLPVVSLDGHARVRLLGVPPRVAVQTNTHLDTLAREARLHPSLTASRLADAVAGFRRRYPTLDDAVAKARRAAAAGVERVDLDLDVDGDGPRLLEELGVLLAETEALAAAGGLLSRTPTPDVVTFRRWLLDQVVAQVAGGEARPYPFMSNPTPSNALDGRGATAAEA
ncbi:MAG TPA: ATP-binding protein [Acidimicrobiales bacterium]|nr:ATP-binding protein [Acidimicrobiales bacterium]